MFLRLAATLLSTDPTLPVPDSGADQLMLVAAAGSLVVTPHCTSTVGRCFIPRLLSPYYVKWIKLVLTGRWFHTASASRWPPHSVLGTSASLAGRWLRFVLGVGSPGNLHSADPPSHALAGLSGGPDWLVMADLGCRWAPYCLLVGLHGSH